MPENSTAYLSWDFWRFSAPDPALEPPLQGAYDLYVVFLSIVVACVAGVTALMVVDRMSVSRTIGERWRWHLAGAGAMGCGIWGMHFTGMLAFSVPIGVGFDVPITLLSMVPAILGAGAALYVLARPRVQWSGVQLGALFMALGIGTMHYTGMEAMEVKGLLRYDIAYFVLSLVIAHVLAMIAIYVRFGLRDFTHLEKGSLKAIAGPIMGFAVAGMHYTAMGAAEFYEIPGVDAGGWMLPERRMAVAIAAVATGILTLGILTTWVEQRALLKALAQLAHTDTLTGLPNRASLNEHLHNSISNSGRFGKSLAVLFIDLDGFKAINDTYGHHAGDEFLRAVASRFDSALRNVDTTIRFGGDEFVVILQGLSAPEDAALVAGKLLAVLEEPVRVAEQQLSGSGSIGISVYPGDGESPGKLLQKADIAMYQAKADGKGYAFFDQKLAKRAADRA